MAISVDTAAPAPGWLRDRTFDLGFILGIAGLALASGLAVVANPDWFLPILAADLWLLGYHHVIATYTRLCFDRESLRSHKFLLFGLPFIVIAGVLALGFGVGLWTLASVYLYWQWFHYTRQSWGVSQVYRRKAGDLVQDREWPSKLVFYAVPVWGILYRSHQDPGLFLGTELRVVPVPGFLVDLAAAAALLAVAWWLATRAVAWWQGRLAFAHTLYMASHFTIFAAAYVFIEDITYGWLVVNVWHNAQYIAFVWLFNTNRFKAGIDPKARFLSRISQAGNAWKYFGVCLGLSTVTYLFLANSAALLLPAIIVYQAVNFHHYVVDGVIWKIRRKPLQKTLGVAATNA